MITAAESPGEIAGTLVGASSAALELRQETALAGRVCSRVLITGESGVGKNRLARMIHRRSIRCRGPVVVVRCGVPDAPLDLGLFARSPVGAGAFERANGGTLILDDVNHLTPELQLRLTGLLSAREGLESRADSARQGNVRIIAIATGAVGGGPRAYRIRPDLYYLLNTIYIPVPPLRERRDDVEPLLEFFIRYYARRQGVAVPTLSDDVRAQCRTYDWPGNLRQLRAAAAMIVVQPHAVAAHEILKSTADSAVRAVRG